MITRVLVATTHIIRQMDFQTRVDLVNKLVDMAVLDEGDEVDWSQVSVADLRALLELSLKGV